jgi:hypothetical protein
MIPTKIGISDFDLKDPETDISSSPLKTESFTFISNTYSFNKTFASNTDECFEDDEADSFDFLLH